MEPRIADSVTYLDSLSGGSDDTEFVSFGGVTRGAKPLDILHGVRPSQIERKEMVPM